MQNVWKAKSSQSISVMSEGTSRSLYSSTKFILWQDVAFDWLPYYVFEGKTDAVRQLLEFGCNLNTKLS